jgi:hypothetical protein
MRVLRRKKKIYFCNKLGIKPKYIIGEFKNAKGEPYAKISSQK